MQDTEKKIRRPTNRKGQVPPNLIIILVVLAIGFVIYRGFSSTATFAEFKPDSGNIYYQYVGEPRISPQDYKGGRCGPDPDYRDSGLISSIDGMFIPEKDIIANGHKYAFIGSNVVQPYSHNGACGGSLYYEMHIFKDGQEIDAITFPSPKVPECFNTVSAEVNRDYGDIKAIFGYAISNEGAPSGTCPGSGLYVVNKYEVIPQSASTVSPGNQASGSQTSTGTQTPGQTQTGSSSNSQSTDSQSSSSTNTQVPQSQGFFASIVQFIKNLFGGIFR